MIRQLNIYGKDKVETAIQRLQTFEPDEGYFLAFSGGKDSVVIKALADMAGVKYDAHYSITSVDPPELVQFIKDKHPDVLRERQYRKDGTAYTMWNLIPEKKMPPTRIVRYCCEKLKETAGIGRFVVTGIRKAESNKRAQRGGVELAEHKTQRMENYDPDNPSQEMIHNCNTYARRTLNPIIDWSDSDVWEFIREYNVPYCGLYDQGHNRLGCIGCPMSYHRKEELESRPKYKRAYIRAFDKMLDERRKAGLNTEKGWQTGEDVYRWWVKDRDY